ncbi:MAG: DEAD/DEAH box helicase [Magnetococcales bacterium]|nr:DEAD/DEAH box helicase [Magnetococcales bacterium]
MTTGNIQKLRTILASPRAIAENPFEAAKEISRICNHDPSDPDAREAVIRALEHADLFDKKLPGVLDSLAEQVGLFPYIDPRLLGTRERLAYEAHKPFSLTLEDGRGIVFHKDQARVYQALMDGHSLVLSAPTSFGKSLIIDALIASGKFGNVVIVVPTIALIDETRRRLSRFRSTHKIITHQNQPIEQRNIFVLTQERVIDRDDITDIDLAVIDEFYKLDPSSDGDGERSSILNDALYKLRKSSRQIYLLGPNINDIPQGFGVRYQCQFFRTDYNTVVSEIHQQSMSPGRNKAFLSLCRSLSDPTMVYCKSPGQANQVLKLLIEDREAKQDQELLEASDWIGDTYHREWSLVRAMQRGVGVHHGKIPRSLAQLMVALFNQRRLDFLVCTSSMIEGVNTSAKNVIVYEGRISRSKLDFFTFRNIQGRAGRMFQHFIGNIYIFDPPPDPELDFVEIPVFSQDEKSPLELLVQLDEADLNQISRTRLDDVYRQGHLTPGTIKDNKHIDPWKQVKVAKDIEKRADSLHRLLAWSGMPKWEQLEATCELIYKHFATRGSKGVGSGSQLAFRLKQLQQASSSRDLIHLYESDNRLSLDADSAVEAAMDFQRTWASFKVPRFLGAINLIQMEVFPRLGLKHGDYSAYISQVENLFLSPELVALEEYGLPVELGRKIQRKLVIGKGLDAAIASLRALDLDQFNIFSFEKRLIESCQSDL